MFNTVEVNGFYVDKFNQYNLPVGKAESVCPLCSHQRKPENKKKKCASLDWERGLGTCHNCNKTFQLHTYQRKGGSDIQYKRPERSVKTHFEVKDKVLEWFNERGISEKTVSELNIDQGPEYMPQTGKEEHTIKFNYMIGDQLINIKYRDARKNFKLFKGAEKIFYNLDSIIGYNWCVIVEGEMDVCAIHEVGIPNVISVPNGATLNHNNLDYLDNCIDYFADKEKIIIAVDNDTAGIALKQELIRRLGSEVCYTVDYGEYKDANEVLLKDSKSLINIIDKALPVPLENVTTFKDLEDDLQDFVKNGFKPGFQIGINNFDNIFSTYTGQFITVTGIPSSGKSDFVDQMVIGYNIGYNWKIGFASPENAPTYLHAHKIMRKIWGGMPSHKDIDGDRWKEISNHINDNYYFIDLEVPSLEAVLRKGAELVKRKSNTVQMG
jgi:twinkle protein